jgi:hypothetical protein
MRSIRTRLEAHHEAMPDPQKLLTTLRRAVQAFRDTPGRRGRVVSLGDAADVIVAGDMHGNVENFRLLLGKAALAAHPRRHLVLQELVHGPFAYPAGGDKSHQLLDLLAALKCQFPARVHMLLGNHELSQWTERLIGKGDVDYNELFRLGVATAYGDAAPDVYATYECLFAELDLAVRTPNRVFMSHSLPAASKLAEFDLSALEREGIDESVWLPGGSAHSLVWGRDMRPSNITAFLQKVDADWLITGHIPCEKGYDVPNERQLILDALGTPACYCLFPADKPVTQQDLVAGTGTL